MEIPRRAGCDAGKQGVPIRRARYTRLLRAGFRLRSRIRFTNSLTPLRMTVVFLLTFSAFASGTTYYVSSSSGNDANNGTLSSAPWATLAHVNAQTFQPGDSILFKRGDVWNESLVPPSSGTQGNPIAFDAYGTGAPPNFTGWNAISTQWANLGGNAWKASVPSTYTTVK